MREIRFTPDATCANKSRYSRVVGRLNILSLLASFAREIRFTPDATSANKSRYSRVVGRLNILSLLASFAREIRSCLKLKSAVYL